MQNWTDDVFFVVGLHPEWFVYLRNYGLEF